VDAASGESCAWYHGFWQSLRLLGLGTTPAGHVELFHQALAKSRARPQVLIAGGADYGMLAHAAAACRASGLQAGFTMVDWCETPLTLARWYAERESLTLTTLQRDLLDIDAEASFDAICTQALLGYFPPGQLPRLFANLHRALRPGGLFVTANRLRPGVTAPVGFSAQQAQEFTAMILDRARAVPGLDADWLANAARSYASRQTQWPVRSAEEVQALLEGAGFRLAHLSCAPMGSEAAAASLNVPTVAGRASYVRVIAFKP
jgi:SAM-dependent methyltransferase